MDAVHEWERLADALKARRKELSRAINRDWRFRKRFVEEHQLDYRTTSDLEEGRRENYSEATFRRTERAYRWSRGSIASIRAGGEPTPIPEPSPGDEGVVVFERGSKGDRLELLVAAAEDVFARMGEEERAAAERDLIQLVTERLRELGADI